MKSHVTQPRSTIKRFGKNGELWYLDLKSNTIKKDGYYINAREGYYNKETEQFLSREIEAPFGKIAKKYVEFANKKLEKITITSSDKDITCRYAMVMLSRSEAFLNEFEKKSVTSSIVSFNKGISMHDFLLDYSVHGTNDFSKYFHENITLVVASGETKFVLPKCGLYAVLSKNFDKPAYIMPVSPEVAVIFLGKTDIRKYTDNNILGYLRAESNQVKKLNDFALSTELNMDNDFIIGEKDELERLLKLNQSM